ncbi:unnamed protein product [Zymoseptoria tritici ST99CH_1E4]|uniref:Uncharacterized protein n=1 Tax=Zymoseptoria tritici ST99CH_1E4 TaxID=1276532 RepID=A0A2H1HA07_ZYMTR|nr:unnamed protein product [Zymoseptoria tritici ST99CH_1E4]
MGMQKIYILRPLPEDRRISTGTAVKRSRELRSRTYHAHHPRLLFSPFAATSKAFIQPNDYLTEECKPAEDFKSFSALFSVAGRNSHRSMLHLPVTIRTDNAAHRSRVQHR